MAKTRTQIRRQYEPPPRNRGNLVLIIAASTTLALFGYYHLVALGQLAQTAQGLTMPDMLLRGYDADDAGSLRAALGQDGLDRLSDLHKTAGTVFPLSFGIAWLLLIQLNVARRPLRWVLWVPPLLFVVADLWENLAIDAMLQSGDAQGVGLASALTVSRWALLALSCLAGIAAVFLPAQFRATTKSA